MKNIILPVIKKVSPLMLADLIIGVQPMSGPVGQIFSLKARYGPTNKEILFKDREIIVTDMIVVHTSLRQFMPPGKPEPNEHYRPWLEEHVGLQGIDWNWAVHENNIDLLEIHFANREHATLFELAWK